MITVIILTILTVLAVYFKLYPENPKQPKKPNTIVIGKDNKPRYNQTGRYAKNEAKIASYPQVIHKLSTKKIKYTDISGLVSWI